MQLLKVYSNKESFRTVEFNETGLSFIVAEQKNPFATEKGRTYNGVGKSLLVRIIHFCFGSDKRHFKSFCEKLPGWEFYVDFLIGGNKDVALTLIDLEEQVKRLEEKLINFKVADDYHEVQVEADRVEKELFTLNNKVILIQNNIENIDESLKIEPTMSKNDIESVYNEANIFFSEKMSKTLGDLEVFYENLVKSRRKKLLEQKNKLMNEQILKINHAEKLSEELDKLMQYLGEHQALDLFISFSNRSAELKNQIENLKKYQEMQAEYKDQGRQKEKIQIEQTEIAEDYLKEMEGEIIELRNYFRGLAKKFYPDSVAGLAIENNDGDNQLRFNIEAKIESDTSDGINNVKIFCYDLTLLFRGYNLKMNFIFHDSRLFDGIDERQKADVFRTINEEFIGTNKQYIATVNQNQLDEIKRQLTETEFKDIVIENTVLTLTDESPIEKLLGIKVDISE